MKRGLGYLWVLTLVLALAACAPAEPPDQPEEEEPLRLESLSVELSRAGLSEEELARTVRELPGTLQEALAAQEVEVETVTVSVGSSPAATAQAVREGGVDLAFFPAEAFAALEQEDPPRLILTAGDGEEGAMAAAVRPDGGTL